MRLFFIGVIVFKNDMLLATDTTAGMYRVTTKRLDPSKG